MVCIVLSSALQSLHLQQITRLRDDRLALLVPFSSMLQDLRLVSCTRLTPRAAQHLSSLTCLTSLDLSGSSSLWATSALSPLHVTAGDTPSKPGNLVKEHNSVNITS